MPNRTVSSFVTVAGLLLTAAAAAQPQLPADLASVPDVIKSGKWKSLDPATASPLEQCRALLLLNHVLDEIAAQATAQADLMSTFIEQQQLGPKFASFGQPPPPPRFTYADGLKIALALLRGPMAQGPTAKAFADLNPNGLQAYQHLYDATCERRWGEVTEAGRQVRCMGAFLKSVNALDAYQRWAPEEAERRQQQYAAEMSQRRAAHAAHEKQAAAEKAKLEQATAADQTLQAENEQLQKALAMAQQQQSPPPQNAAAQGQAYSSGDGDDDPWGLNFYGAVDNLRRSDWARDAAYAGAARNATGARIAGWHGAGGGGGGGGRR